MIKLLFRKIKSALKLFRLMLNQYTTKDISLYWKQQNSFDYANMFLDRHKKAEDFIQTKFIPLVSKNDILAEYACGEGQLTIQISPFVKHIYASDISNGLIHKAIQNAKNKNIDNITFTGGVDLIQHQITNKYNHTICLGLFTYIQQDNDFKSILSKISNSMISRGGGSYLLIKDTIRDGETMIYKHKGYMAIYRNIQEYLDFYNDDFNLISHIYLADFDETNQIGSIMCLFKKRIKNNSNHRRKRCGCHE